MPSMYVALNNDDGDGDDDGIIILVQCYYSEAQVCYTNCFALYTNVISVRCRMVHEKKLYMLLSFRLCAWFL